MAEHHLDVMVGGDNAVVVENLVEGVAQDAGVGLGQTAPLRGGVAVILVIDDGTLVVVEVHAKVDAELEAVEKGILIHRPQRNVGTGRCCVAVVVRLVVEELGLGVEALRRGTVGIAVVVLVTILVLAVAGSIQDVVTGYVLQVNGIDRTHELGGVPHVGSGGTREVLVVGRRVGQVGAETGLKPVGRLRIHVDAAGVAFEVRVLQNTLFIVVAQRNKVVALGRAAGEGEHVFGAGCTVVGDLLHPVLVPASHGIGLHQTGRGVNESGPGVVLIGIVVLRILEAADLRTQVGRCIGAGALEVHTCSVLGAVSKGLIHHLDKILRTQEVVRRECPRSHAEGSLVGDAGAVLGTFPGGDDDDAVGAACAVEGTGRCILQHRHALDIGRVDAAQGAVVRNAVHHIERRVIGADGANTAHRNGGVLARLSAARGHGHTGHAAFQALGHGAYRSLLQVFTLYHGRRAGKGFLLGGTVGHHHGVVKFQGLLVQDNINLRTAVHRHFQRLVSDAGNAEHGIGRHFVQGVVSVQRSTHTHRGSLHEYSRSYDRQSAAVRHRTAHGQGPLRKQLRACNEQRRQGHCYLVFHLFSNSF